MVNSLFLHKLKLDNLLIKVKVKVIVDCQIGHINFVLAVWIMSITGFLDVQGQSQNQPIHCKWFLLGKNDISSCFSF